jgi:hypothetical protein
MSHLHNTTMSYTTSCSSRVNQYCLQLVSWCPNTLLLVLNGIGTVSLHQHQEVFGGTRQPAWDTDQEGACQQGLPADRVGGGERVGGGGAGKRKESVDRARMLSVHIVEGQGLG